MTEMIQEMREVQERYLAKYPQLGVQLTKPAILFMCMLWEQEEKDNQMSDDEDTIIIIDDNQVPNDEDDEIIIIDDNQVPGDQEIVIVDDNGKIIFIDDLAS